MPGQVLGILAARGARLKTEAVGEAGGVGGGHSSRMMAGLVVSGGGGGGCVEWFLPEELRGW